MDFQWPLILGIFFLCVVFIVSLLSNIVNIWRNTRSPARQPALSEELYRDFATKSELIQLRSEYLKTMGEAFDAVRRLQAAVESELRSQTAALSRIEGKLENCPGPDVCAQLRAMMSQISKFPG